MTIEERKIYLRNYRIYLMRSERIREMIRLFPEDTSRFEPQLTEAKRYCEWIEKAVTAMDSPLYSELLARKYFAGCTIEELCELLHYSKRQIERLLKQAIEAFDLMMPDLQFPKFASLQTRVPRV